MVLDGRRAGKEVLALHLDKSLRLRAHLILVRPGGLEGKREGCC